MAHVDYFLKIDGIDGESIGKGHENQIEVDSFSWGLSRHAATGGGGGAAGRAQFTGLNFGAVSSKASPPMLLAAASGKHIKFAILTGSKTRGQGVDFLKIKFTDVLISSYQESAISALAENMENAGNNQPMDQVTLNFAKIEFSFISQTEDGALSDQTLGNWDLDKDQGF